MHTNWKKKKKSLFNVKKPALWRMLCNCPQRSGGECNSVTTYHWDCLKDGSGQMLSGSRKGWSRPGKWDGSQTLVRSKSNRNWQLHLAERWMADGNVCLHERLKLPALKCCLLAHLRCLSASPPSNFRKKTEFFHGAHERSLTWGFSLWCVINWRLAGNIHSLLVY